MVAERSAKAIAAELGMEIPEDIKGELGDLIGPKFGDNQFYEIIQFMTGPLGEGLVQKEKEKPGAHRCLLLVYAGAQCHFPDSRHFGTNRPQQGAAGSVRREIRPGHHGECRACF